MEKPPFRFEDITHFSIGGVEKPNPRIHHAVKLSLEIGSRIPSGKYSLTMIEPFPPFGRLSPDLAKLRSCQEESIRSIWVFPPSSDERSPGGARVEITTTAGERAIFRCKEIQGLPACAYQTE